MKKSLVILALCGLTALSVPMAFASEDTSLKEPAVVTARGKAEEQQESKKGEPAVKTKEAAEVENATVPEKVGGKEAGTSKKRLKFADCDKDSDGFLTKEEFMECYPRSAKKFDAMDTNKDGRVSKEEAKAYASKKKVVKKKSTEENSSQNKSE